MALLGKKRTHTSFDKFMRTHNMHKPGHAVSIKVIDKFLGNILPKNPTCADCRAQDLARLTYTNKFKDDGLLHGRYSGKNGPVFRTYPVSANHSFVMGYTSKAFNAATRGKKLNGSTAVSHMKHKKANDAHFDVALDALSNIT